jgi:hypothetical protein
MPKAQKRRGQWRYVEEPEAAPPPVSDQTVRARIKEETSDGCLVACILCGLSGVDCCCALGKGACSVVCCCSTTSCWPSCGCVFIYCALGILALTLWLGLAPMGPFATVAPSDYLRALFSSKL